MTQPHLPHPTPARPTSSHHWPTNSPLHSRTTSPGHFPAARQPPHHQHTFSLKAAMAKPHLLPLPHGRSAPAGRAQPDSPLDLAVIPPPRRTHGSTTGRLFLSCSAQHLGSPAPPCRAPPDSAAPLLDSHQAISNSRRRNQQPADPAGCLSSPLARQLLADHHHQGAPPRTAPAPRSV